MQVRHLELHRAGASKLIDLGIKGHIHPAAGGQPQLGPVGGKENGVQRGPLGLQPQLQVAAPPHLGHGLDQGPPQHQDGPGVASTAGLQPVQIGHRLHSELPGLHLCVGLQGGWGCPGPQGPLQTLPQAAGEKRDVLLPHGEAGGQGVAAEALQQVTALCQPLKQVHTAPGAARALPHPVVQADHKRRAAVPLRQAGGHDAHHALVPLRIGQQHRPLLGGPVQPIHTLPENLALNGLPLPVQGAQLLGQLLPPLPVPGEEELHRHLGPAHPAGGVDPGRQGVADGGGGDGLVLQPRLPDQQGQAQPAGVGELLQPQPDDGPVLPGHRHHVGHRPHGGQVTVLRQHVSVPFWSVDGHGQLQGHPHAGQALAGAGAVAAPGVHHRLGGGQAALALVVVRDDHIDPQGPGPGGLLQGSNAAVHRDDQGGALLLQGRHRLPVQAVALLQPVWDIGDDCPALPSEEIGQQAGGGDAIHIVVPVDCDGLSPLQSQPDPAGRLCHILQSQRVLQGRLPTLQQGPGLLRHTYAPGGQHRRQQR